MAVFLCLLLLCFTSVFSFNVDIESRVVHKGTPNSMFGFTVQAHLEGDQRMLLVGAPEADPRRQQDVEKPGAVFRCEPGSPGRCREVIFDTKGNNVNRDQQQVDMKSNQWFGATLSSTGANGPIVACAPRYVSFVSPSQNQRNPVGSCFLASSTSSPTNGIKEFTPCRTTTHGERKTGMCQAGFAAAISKDGQRLFMGAPGSWYWQGQMFSLDSSTRFDYFMPKIPEEGQLYSQSLNQKPTLISTLEGSPKFDDSYMGYSVTVGDFAGQAVQGVAVGVPRGADLRGLVVLYTWELQNIKNISGSQIGAYFGYCLASGDIDGDGYDDVIVGSPMFSNTKSDGYEHGRVYVIYQGKDRSFQRHHARTGEVSQGRFGLSVASLGDINLDGFGDFAVGAPYGGPNGRGVVFIYHGSDLGVREKYSQAITAEDVSSPPYLSTFGFSLSGGVDLDNNNYTDLIVGAYKSDSVVFFRSRPVVTVMAEVLFMGESKLISLDDKKCTLRNGTSVVCARLMFCLTYNGTNVNRQIDFRVTLDLDSKQKTSKRLFLMESRQTTYSEHILLIQGKQGCREVNVYLDDDIRDKLTPIEVSMTYELTTQYAGDVIPPVLDQTTNNVVTDSLHIQKNCGRDNICVPDLKMSATTPNINYVLGSTENVNIEVKVENSGEDAFEAAYYLHIPNGVTYSKMERLDKEEANEAPIYCSILSRDASGNSTLKCDLGNPMPRSQLVRFRVILEVDSRVTLLNFDMTSNSTNPEHGTGYDNSQHLAIGVVIRAHLEIIGTSDPPELHYNASLYQSDDQSDDTKLGPQVIHKYNIKNEGPFAVDEAEIYIMWPYQTLDGDNLMYMLVQPEWIGDMNCDVAKHVNPLNLFVHNPYNSPLLNEKEAMLKSELYKGISISRGGGYYGQTYLEEGAPPKSASSSHSYQGGSQVYHNRGGGAYDESETQGQTFSSQEEDSIRRNLAAAVASRSGERQESYNQNNNGQGNFEQRNYDARNYEQKNFDQRNYGQNNYEKSYGVDANAIGGGAIGGAGQVIRRWNKTISYDSQGNVIENVESSTEFGSLGHEGEAGSSFNNRYGADAASHHQHQQSNQNGQEEWRYSSTGNNDRKHTWSTEESINRDLYHAGSSTYRDDKITVVGDEGDEIGGLGAYAAQSPNNEFKYGVADLGISGGQSSAGQSSRGYSRGQVHESGHEYGQGYGRGGEYDGQARAGYSAASARSSSRGGYAYSSSSSSRQGSDAAYNSQYESTYNSQRRDNTRRRRQSSADPQLEGLVNRCQEKYKCQVIRCTTGRMAKGQEVWLALRSRINASVLNEITQDRAVKLSTLAAARVSKLPMIGRPSEPSWHTAEAQTLVTPQLEVLSSGSVPLWVIILAAIVGALLLLLLIFLLYKCGFFKRNRPSDHAERQPLNGRDEHL